MCYFEITMSIYEFQVFLEDTDAIGIVYHSRYLNFMERARTLYFKNKGLDHHGMVLEKKASFVVSKINLSYKKSATLGDVLQVQTEVKEIRGASIVCVQRIYKGLELIVDGQIVLAHVCYSTFKPIAIPHHILVNLI